MRAAVHDQNQSFEIRGNKPKIGSDLIEKTGFIGLRKQGLLDHFAADREELQGSITFHGHGSNNSNFN